jgi:hypothetical protein
MLVYLYDVVDSRRTSFFVLSSFRTCFVDMRNTCFLVFEHCLLCRERNFTFWWINFMFFIEISCFFFKNVFIGTKTWFAMRLRNFMFFYITCCKTRVGFGSCKGIYS